jgi:ABC-2 type transport system permease protein
MLRGADFSDMWTEVAALSAFIVVMMGVAIVRFRKRLD